MYTLSVSSYFMEFVIYSFLGWLWESVYCTLKEKEWRNRGYKAEFDQRAEGMYRQLAAAPQKVEQSIASAKENALNRREYAGTEHEDWTRLLAERYTEKMSRSQKEILQKIKHIEVKGISRKFENLPQLDDLKKSLKERKKDHRT